VECGKVVSWEAGRWGSMLGGKVGEGGKRGKVGRVEEVGGISS